MSASSAAGPLPLPSSQRCGQRLPAPCVSAGMLTITDFINILHRYYRSPLVSAAGRARVGVRAGMGQGGAVPTSSGPLFITRP